MKDVIIIGGGASGLIAAIYAAKNGAQVCLLEKNNQLGKKILITGNGKCNYWNSDQSLDHYHTKDKEILERILTKDNQQKVLNFFDQIGIIPKIRDGYYYPASNQATSIQTALIKEAELQGIEIITNCEVLKITHQSNLFTVQTTNTNLTSHNLIIATGSKACPKTGSTGQGYQFATSLGHSLIKPLPALVQLQASAPYLKEWHGIRSDVKISLIENNQLINSQVGEIQLTNYGISGICTLCLSGQIARGLSLGKKEQVQINFLHYLNLNTKEAFTVWMDNRHQKIKNRSISDLLDGLLNYKLINLILKLSKIDRHTSWDKLTMNQKYLLGQNLTTFILTITGTNSFDQAQTCTGGIPLIEINPHTMMSTKVNHLYLTGELLDVDGDCGGYNLSFAWLTGMIAGSSIKGGSND